jgi:predicted dehydrogenase
MSTFQDIGAAVIGTGFIGTVHVEQLRRIGVDVRGVLGSTPERGAARAEALSVRHAYASLDEILADPSVDVVHVTSPNHLHVPQAAAILAAGKHVVCEKPLALNAAESARLVVQAVGSGLVNAVNFNIRFYPLHQHIRERVAAGDLGDVRLVTGHYFQDWLLLDTDWNWRLEPDQGGVLRAVGDIGSHWLDLMAYVTGQPIVSVMADLATFVTARQQPAGPVETFSPSAPATRSNGRWAPRTWPRSCSASPTARAARSPCRRSAPAARTRSSGRSMGPPGPPPGTRRCPSTCGSGHRDRPNELLLRNPALMGPAGQAAAALPGGHVEGFGDTFGALFRAIYADVLAGRPSPNPAYATFAAGHDEMLVNDAIALSATERRWVNVERGVLAAATLEATR